MMENSWHMRNKRKYSYLIRLLLIALFLAALPPGDVHAEPSSGRLAVMLEDALYNRLPSGSTIELTLYRIGEIDTEGGGDWKMLDDFADYGVLTADSTSDIVDVAGQISAMVEGTDAEAYDQTMTGGRAVFSELPLGIYLGKMRSGPTGLVIDPFIVSIPAFDQSEENYYDYAVTPKAYYIPPLNPSDDDDDNDEGNANKNPSGTPSPSPSPSPRLTPRPTSAPRGTTTTRTTSVKTGDVRPILIWITLMAAGLLILIAYGRHGPEKKGR